MDVSQLNHLPPGLATKLPGIAVRCHLSMVRQEQEDNWGELAIQVLTGCLDGNDLQTAMFVERKDRSVGVLVKKEKQGKFSTINKRLLEQGCAVSTVFADQTGVDDPDDSSLVDEWDTMPEVLFNQESQEVDPAAHRSGWPRYRGQGLYGGGGSVAEEDCGKLSKQSSLLQSRKIILEFDPSPSKRRSIVSEYKQRTPVKMPTPTKRRIFTPIKKAPTPKKRKIPRLKCANESCHVGFSSLKSKIRHERFQCQVNTPRTESPASSLDLKEETECRFCGKAFKATRTRKRHEQDVHPTCLSGTSSILGSIQSNISDEDDSSASSSGWFHNAYPDFYLLLLQEDLGPVVSAEHLI